MSKTTSTSAAARILVVDDEPDLRTLYELTLIREGYRVESAASVGQARDLLQAGEFDVVISDMRLPDGLGLDLLRDLSRTQRPERCVVMTAYGSAENAVEALKAGAFDYLTKPVDLRQFRTVVASAVQESPLAPGRTASVHSRGAAQAPRTESSAATGNAIKRLDGHSAVMNAVRERIAKVARSMAPVLIQGESGTGKELVARAIHASSHRCDGPFIAVNCGAIPENLLEAEFFGARKGAYTGSVQDREGYFQAATSGTLFLDEIGDLPLGMQSKLLRAIQERSVRPLGSTQEEAVDARIVSATHRDLGSLVQEGLFRQDLYFRLNVIDIRLPPLRERRDDLPDLCNSLLSRIAQEYGLATTPKLSASALALLVQHPLEGNVRELENILYRAVALGDAGELELESSPSFQPISPSPPQSAPVPNDLQSWLDDQEREMLVRTLRETNYNRTAAAGLLGLSLRQIRYRIARLNISTPDSGDPNDVATPD